MLLFFALLTAITALAILLAGMLALVRNNRDVQNRWFFLVTLFVASWIAANFYDSNFVHSGLTQWALKLDFILALFIAWSLLEFSGVLLAPRVNAKATNFSARGIRYPSLALNLGVVLLILYTNLIVASSITSGALTVDYRGLFWLYAGLTLLYFAYAFGILLYRRRHVNQNDTHLLNIIFFGVFFALVANVLSNIIFPAMIANTTTVKELNAIGYIGMLVFVVSIYLAITRQRLFDIRLVVARSLGYAASILVLAGLYGVVVFGIAKYVFKLDIPLVAQATLAAATGFTGLVFPYLKKIFDRLTNQLFYRDAYDAQELFGRLNTMLVSSLDMRYLMMQSVAMIETTLKAEFALIGLRGETEKHRIFTKHKVEFSPKDIALVRQLTPLMRDRKVIVADYLDDPKLTGLQDLMRRNNVGVIVRLTQNTRSREDGLGYLVLGNKKSGNPYTQQDMRVLDTVANELIIAIQNALHYEEIQQFNLVLQGRVDEATRKLRRTNEKLKALDETKDDFISMASHQLRTPLTSVKGYLSMVLEGDAGKLNATQHKMLQQAFTSSQRMVYLIADLLNVSRLRTGKFVIEAVPTNLSLMIEEELAQLVEAAKVKDVELTYGKPKEFPELMLDETKTRQVIMNLIDNAIYYTPSGGHIRVELTSTDRTVELRVVDDGIGVPKAEQHHLFTKFYRAGNARKARPDGTGLGLFMAKKVVIAQGGSIIFDSQENVGSTFGFSFPKSRTAAVVTTVPVASEKPAKTAVAK